MSACVACKDERVLGELLANRNYADEEQNSVLIKAACNGHVILVRHLLQVGGIGRDRHSVNHNPNSLFDPITQALTRYPLFDAITYRVRHELSDLDFFK